MDLISLVSGILFLVSAVWVIYDVFTNNKKLKTTHKVLWTIAAIFFGIVTAIVYYFVYKNK